MQDDDEQEPTDEAVDEDFVEDEAEDEDFVEDDDWSEGVVDRESRWAPSGPALTRGLALGGVFLLGLATSLVLVLTWKAVSSDAGEQGTGEQGTGPGASLAGSSELPGGVGDSGSSSGTSSEASDPVTEATPAGQATRLARCARAASTLEAPLSAARPALDQWQLHVQAMNQLVVGEISLQQATDFWNRTRLGAQRRVTDFRNAMVEARRTGVDCPSAELLAPGARALPGCARQVEGELGALLAARTSIDMWDRHIHQMDMLRLGELSAEDATRMWLSMWRRGARDLEDYRAAASQARGLYGCAAAGSRG